MADILPGTYVSKMGSDGVPLQSARDFIGLPVTREVCMAAQAAVNGLRAHAERLRQYTFLHLENGVEVRAYYGEAGQALHNAEEIKRVINDCIYGHYYLLDLRIQ